MLLGKRLMLATASFWGATIILGLVIYVLRATALGYQLHEAAKN